MEKVKQTKPTPRENWGAQRSFQPPAITSAPADRPAEEKVSADSQAMQVEGNSVQSVQEYADEIHSQMFDKESSVMPNADLMSVQKDITDKMRTILMDWLVEVHMKYRLAPETLHLTVNIIDRYLSKVSVMRKRLQLIGVAAMFIASKFEQINPPELSDWIYICDNAYDKKDLLAMECSMLTTLNFQVAVPTASHFFALLEKVNNCDDVHRETARYILELSLLDIRMLQYRPSHVVSAAIFLSNELFKRSPQWPVEMEEQSRCKEQELSGCVEQLRQLLEQDRAKAGGQLQAVHKKFSSPQRHGVATMKF
jgi:cyclin B